MCSVGSIYPVSQTFDHWWVIDVIAIAAVVSHVIGEDSCELLGVIRAHTVLLVRNHEDVKSATEHDGVLEAESNAIPVRFRDCFIHLLYCKQRLDLIVGCKGVAENIFHFQAPLRPQNRFLILSICRFILLFEDQLTDSPIVEGSIVDELEIVCILSVKDVLIGLLQRFFLSLSAFKHAKCIVVKVIYLFAALIVVIVVVDWLWRLVISEIGLAPLDG